MKNKISKLEIFLWTGVIVVFGILFLTYQLIAKNGTFVQVSVSGKIVETYSLDKDATYIIDGKDKGKNILVIRDGKAFISEANCPDKLCVKQGGVSKVGQSLICLPNRVVVEVVHDRKEQSAETGVDAIVK